MVRVANEAEFILNRQRAEDIQKNAEFEVRYPRAPPTGTIPSGPAHRYGTLGPRPQVRYPRAPPTGAVPSGPAHRYDTLGPRPQVRYPRAPPTGTVPSGPAHRYGTLGPRPQCNEPIRVLGEPLAAAGRHGSPMMNEQGPAGGSICQDQDLWRLDYWEDDLRRRRRLVRNPLGSAHLGVTRRPLEDYVPDKGPGRVFYQSQIKARDSQIKARDVCSVSVPDKDRDSQIKARDVCSSVPDKGRDVCSVSVPDKGPGRVFSQSQIKDRDSQIKAGTCVLSQSQIKDRDVGGVGTVGLEGIELPAPVGLHLNGFLSSFQGGRGQGGRTAAKQAPGESLTVTNGPAALCEAATPLIQWTITREEDGLPRCQKASRGVSTASCRSPETELVLEGEEDAAMSLLQDKDMDTLGGPVVLSCPARLVAPLLEVPGTLSISSSQVCFEVDHQQVDDPAALQ
ncbi:hypothetical protein NHX12_008746, partial [Muraenolepis orangiensis]